MAGPVIPPGFEIEGLSSPGLPEGFEIENVPVATPPLLARPKPAGTDHSFLRGVGLGFQQPIAELGHRLRNALPSALTSFVDGLPPRAGEGRLPPIGQRYPAFKRELENNTSGLGKGVGNMAALAPTVAIPGGPLVQGGVQGFALSGAQDPLDVAVDTAVGSASAFGGDRAVKWAAGAVSPVVNAGAQRLRNAGVDLTPGEILGGRWKVAEDKLMSLPGSGDVTAIARTRGIETFSRAAANRTLAEIGESVPANIPPGRKMIEYVQSRVKDRYAKVVPTLTAKIDSTFAQRLTATQRRANLPQAQAEQFDDIIQREVAQSFDPKTGAIRGRDLKDLEERLGDLARSYNTSDDPYVRRLGGAIADTRSHLLDLLRRQNPRAAAELRKANGAYANMARLETAAAGTRDGVVTPARLSVSVRQNDATVRKGGYAAGKARMQDLADDGDAVMSNKTPNSFTWDRMVLGGGLLGGAAWNPAVIAPSALLAAPYAPGARQVVQAVMTGRQGPRAQLFGNALRRARPLGALAVPPLLARPE